VADAAGVARSELRISRFPRQTGKGTYCPIASVTGECAVTSNLIIGWVNGKCEIGPRALGNRSILASPFHGSTRVRLNAIKQRDQFRPIAPVSLEEDAARWFGCDHPSPFMLYTQLVSTEALAAVTHVNGTARIQTVSSVTNSHLHKPLMAFKAHTGYGVLCNTSLNFKGRGFINNIADLSAYTIEHNLDGFVIEGRSYMLKSSKNYQAYLRSSTLALVGWGEADISGIRDQDL
jgi:predicted NodU family carbamoyl transferase